MIRKLIALAVFAVGLIAAFVAGAVLQEKATAFKNQVTGFASTLWDKAKGLFAKKPVAGTPETAA